MKMLARVMLCLLFGMLVACGQQQSNQQHEIRMAVAQPVINLDPRYATDAASARVNRLLYQSLIQFDSHFQPQAQLANWRQISPQEYLFTLISSPTKFHDGMPLSAADVAATYQSMQQIASPLSAEFANIAQVQAVDSQHVRFVLKQPDPDFVAKLIIGILPASLIKAGHDFNQQPIGSGPLRFVRHDASLLLQRVADGQFIRLMEIKDPTVRVLKLMHSEVDILQGDLPPELVSYLNKQSGVKISVSEGANYSYLGLNLRDQTLRMPLVRQALAYAIDTQKIVRYGLVPGSRAATAILPPQHWAGNAQLTPYPYRPEYAKTLLKQAGVELPLRLEYKTSSDPQRLRLATMLQAQMRAAGIQLNIKSHDWGTFFGDIQQGHFQMYGLTWVGIKTPDIYDKAFATSAIPPQGFNRGHYQDDTLDKLLQQRDWPAVTQRIHQQLPYIPLWYEGQVVALRDGVEGFHANLDGNWDDLAKVKKQMNGSN